MPASGSTSGREGTSQQRLRAHSSHPLPRRSPGTLGRVCEPAGKYFWICIRDNVNGRFPECGGVLWPLPGWSASPYPLLRPLSELSLISWQCAQGCASKSLRPLPPRAASACIVAAPCSTPPGAVAGFLSFQVSATCPLCREAFPLHALRRSLPARSLPPNLVPLVPLITVFLFAYSAVIRLVIN